MTLIKVNVPLDRLDAVRVQPVAAEHGDAAVRRGVEAVVEARAGGERRDGAGRKLDARDMRDAALLDERKYGGSVRREPRPGVIQLDARGPRDRTALDVDDGERPGRVVDPLVLAGLQVGDALAVRAPGGTRLERRVVVRAGEAW